MQTMAAHEGQRAKKRRTHMQDNEQRQKKYPKTDINYNDRPQTSSYGVPNEKNSAALANDEVSNEVAEILQSLRSATNRSGRNHHRSSRADQPMPGSLLETLRTYGAPHWTKLRYAGLFEEMDGEMPKPIEMDWTVPQRKQDSRGRGYYSSGKMNGNRKIWTRE